MQMNIQQPMKQVFNSGPHAMCTLIIQTPEWSHGRHKDTCQKGGSVLPQHMTNETGVNTVAPNVTLYLDRLLVNIKASSLSLIYHTSLLLIQLPEHLLATQDHDTT